MSTPLSTLHAGNLEAVKLWIKNLKVMNIIQSRRVSFSTLLWWVFYTMISHSGHPFTITIIVVTKEKTVANSRLKHDKLDISYI